MRDTFAQEMTRLAKERKDVVLLSGDIGNRMFDSFKDEAPKRFINCGIAEANMMSVAAGMGLYGLRPVVYTITPFNTTRCLEQIKISVAYHDAPVVIVGTGSGLSYSELGATHHSLEDMAILRSIPNMQICAPTDSLQLKTQLREAISTGRPTYIRIGKKEQAVLTKNDGNLGIGKSQLIKTGKRIIVLGVGPILSEAIRAAGILKEEGIDVAIASMGSIKPLDKQFLKNMVLKGFSHWITLEEHYKIGGLGSAIIEWLSENQIDEVQLIRMGISDHFLNILGDQEYSRSTEEVDHAAIARQVRSI